MRRRLIRALCSVATLIAVAFVLSPAEAHSPRVKEPLCRARVVHSEELPYAWLGSWLARVTLVVATPDGHAFETTVTKTVPSQRSAPRFGETYWLRCDPGTWDAFY